MAQDAPGTPPHVGLEIREGWPWWKICCIGCFVLVVAIIVLIGAAWHGFGGGGPQTLTALPPNFPPSVGVYRLEDAKSIVYLPGKEKDRLITLVLSPFRFFGNVMVSESATGTGGAPKPWVDQVTESASITQLQKMDTVTITWERLQADRDEVEKWYLGGFQRNGFAVTSRRDAATATDVMIAQRSDARVQLQLQDLPDISGIDTVTMVVDYLNQ